MAVQIFMPMGTRQPISDIAFAHGFQSQSHFSRAFRQKFGCSPNQLRKAGLS